MEKYKPVFGYRLKPNPSNKEFIKHPVYTTFSQMVVTHHQNVLNLCPPPLCVSALKHAGWSMKGISASQMWRILIDLFF